MLTVVRYELHFFCLQNANLLSKNHSLWWRYAAFVLFSVKHSRVFVGEVLHNLCFKKATDVEILNAILKVKHPCIVASGVLCYLFF